MTNKRIPSEHAEQVRVIKWFDRVHRDIKGALFAVPNGAHLAGRASQRQKQVSRLKAEGMRTGVPDLILPVAHGGYHGMAVEMKRSEGGELSKVQGRWITSLKRFGWRVEVCEGADEAIDAISDYLDQKPTEVFTD